MFKCIFLTIYGGDISETQIFKFQISNSELIYRVFLRLSTNSYHLP